MPSEIETSGIQATRPIIMSGNNPKLILEGRKIKTRRIVVDKRLSPKLTLLELLDFLGGGGQCDGSQNDDEGLRISFVKDYDRQDDDGRRYKYTGLLVQSEAVPGDGSEEIACPYGVAGDRLWVREAFSIGRWWRRKAKAEILGWYECDNRQFNVKLTEEESALFFNWQRKHGVFPSIFMFLSLSRIALEITKVRVERLQYITPADVQAEGFPYDGPQPEGARIRWYRELWDSLHGKGAWDKNPWVWAIEFRLSPKREL